VGIAIAVSLLASLGTFLAHSKATMTKRATSGVAVDWQVAVQPNAASGGVASVLKAIRNDSGTLAALPRIFANTNPGGGTASPVACEDVLRHDVAACS